MSLTEELAEVVLRFARGEGTLDELQDWLAGHVQAVADESLQQARPLVNEIWFLLDDYSHQFLTREALRRKLPKLVSEVSREASKQGRGL